MEILLPIAGESLSTGALESLKVSSSLTDRGIFFLSGVFDSAMAKSVVTWILEANFAKVRDYENLTLIINSPGGAVASAFAIIDVMRGSVLPVYTIGLGMIGSCGLLTFLAGTKGHRTLTPNTSILSHQWSWGVYGSKEHELFAAVKEYDLTSTRMMNHYKKCTGLKESIIKEKLLPPHDVWLSAEEAKELNLCDNVKDMWS
jgi:ATP-dependent Clp protease protease subunit